jgi:hypothetical protein
VVGKLGLGKFGGRQARFRQAFFAELAERNSASPVYSFRCIRSFSNQNKEYEKVFSQAGKGIRADFQDRIGNFGPQKFSKSDRIGPEFEKM